MGINYLLRDPQLKIATKLHLKNLEQLIDECEINTKNQIIAIIVTNGYLSRQKNIDSQIVQKR